MSLLSILNQAAVGLDVQQGVTQTASQNIANANTPGYTRQVANLAATEPALLQNNSYLGQGVELQSVTQVTDPFVEAQLPAAYASSSQASAEASTLTAMTAFDPNQTGGLSSSLSAFYGSLQALAQNPGQASLQQSAVASAQALALSFNQTSQAITQAQDSVDTQLTGLVSQVNTLSAQLASLNDQVRSAQASGASPNDLLDERAQVASQLEQLTGATPVPDTDGDVNLMLPGGQALVSGDQASTLSTATDPTTGHLDLQIAAPHEAPQPVAGADGSIGIGGQMGGLVTARDGALGSALSQVDSLAYDLASSINAVQTSGFTSAGQPGQALFVVGAGAPGTAASISVNSALASDPTQLANASSAAGGTGDGSNIQNMIATQNAALATSGQTPVNTLAGLTTTYGAQAQTAQNDQTQTQAVLTNLQNMQSSVSGVSIDEETTTLDSAQRVYQALAQVITTTNTMLDALFQIQ